jgi:hypothetical protein
MAVMVHAILDIADDALDMLGAAGIPFGVHTVSSEKCFNGHTVTAQYAAKSQLSNIENGDNMALYVIADLHLSTTTDKSMEVFGARWADYTEKLRRNWTALVAPEDTVVIPGDISWALTLDEARGDFAFLDSLPGKKILAKGNHDFWWSSMAKMQAFLSVNGFSTISFLYHNAVRVEDFILCGTRGWFRDEKDDDIPDAEAARLTAREALRLGMSLDEAMRLQKETPDATLIAFFHFPPVWAGVACEAFTQPLERLGIRRCYFGHIHGAYHVPAYTDLGGVRYTLVSADYLSFTPLHIPRADQTLPVSNGVLED